MIEYCNGSHTAAILLVTFLIVTFAGVGLYNLLGELEQNVNNQFIKPSTQTTFSVSS